MHVFLSYSRRDAAFVGRLADDLEARGIDPWLDTDDLPTDDEDRWRRSVIQGIRASSSVILVLSPDSVRSEAVEREVTAAAEMSRRIIPIVHRPCELSDSVLFELAGVQRTDFVGQPYDIALDQLVTRVRTVPTPSDDDSATPAGSPGSETNAGTPPAPVPIGTIDRPEGQDDRAVLVADETAAPRGRRTLAVTTIVLLLVAAIAVAGVSLLRDDSEDASPGRAPSTTELASSSAATSDTAADSPADSASNGAVTVAPVRWDDATASLERRDGTATTVKAATVKTACATGEVQLTTGQTISLELVHDIVFDTIYIDTASADGTVTLLDGRVLDDAIYTWNCPIDGTNDLGPVSIPLDDIRRITFHRDPAAAPDTAADSPADSASNGAVTVAPVRWDDATASLERRDGTATTVKAATVKTACATGEVQLTTGQTISLELVHDIVFDTIYIDTASADGTVTLLDGRVLDDAIYTWNCPIDGTNDLGPVSIPLDDIRRITFHR